jgi:hypothetical protein
MGEPQLLILYFYSQCIICGIDAAACLADHPGQVSNRSCQDSQLVYDFEYSDGLSFLLCKLVDLFFESLN